MITIRELRDRIAKANTLVVNSKRRLGKFRANFNLDSLIGESVEAEEAHLAECIELKNDLTQMFKDRSTHNEM